MQSVAGKKAVTATPVQSMSGVQVQAIQFRTLTGVPAKVVSGAQAKPITSVLTKTGLRNAIHAFIHYLSLTKSFFFKEK